jgi:RimJ/RimL family protein N-acetyltransferase
MEVASFSDARSFRAVADPLLLAAEERNNLILGVTGILLSDPGAFDRFRAWVVSDTGEPLAAGAVAGHHNVIVADARSAPALRRLAEAIDDIPGAIGALPWIEAFIAVRLEAAQLTMRQGIFALDDVAAFPAARGESGPASGDHEPVLEGWARDFQREALGALSLDDDTFARSVADRIATQSPDYGLWVHTVAMSGHNGPTPNGIRVSGVFTPPEHRGNGYATSLVGRQSQWLLDAGRRFCFLYTDLANPTSNAIYRRIGYRQVAESHEYSFSPKT